MKNLKKENVDKNEILNIVNKIIVDDKTLRNLKMYYPDEIEKIEEALLHYMCESNLKSLKTGFPDKWKYITEKTKTLAYP